MNSVDVFKKRACPISHEKVQKYVLWSNTEKHKGQFALLSDSIVVSRPEGFTGEKEGRLFIEALRKIVQEKKCAETGFVLIEDYEKHTGTTQAARKQYIRELSKIKGLKSVIFFKVSRTFKFSIRLGRALNIVPFQVHIAEDYQSALTLSFQLLNKKMRKEGNQNDDQTLSTKKEEQNKSKKTDAKSDTLQQGLEFLASIDWSIPGEIKVEDFPPQIESLVHRVNQMKKDVDFSLRKRQKKYAELNARRERSSLLLRELQQALEDSRRHRLEADTAATRNLKLQNDILENQREVIRTLGILLEERSGDRPGHLNRIAKIVSLLAKKLEEAPEHCEILAHASALHDVGLIGVPDTVLQANPRTPEQELLYQSHPKIGYAVLLKSKQPLLQEAAFMARDHHENWDGSGYPQKLKGNEIHLSGRILAFAQELDEHYSRGEDLLKIVGELGKMKGTILDPKLCEIFEQFADQFIEVLDDLKQKNARV